MSEGYSRSMQVLPGPFVTSHAVLIGIDRYPDGFPPLRTAVSDATRLATLLDEAHGYDTITLVDEDATGRRIMQLLTEELPRRVGPDDRVLFYWAGHGVARDGDTGPNGYLLPSDARPDDATSFLHMPQVHDALVALPCRHMLVILDSCFSGAFRWSATRDGQPEDGVVHQEKYARFVRDPAWLVLTSSAQDELALDRLSMGALGNRGDEAGHSPFALALFRALEGEADVVGGRTGDGLVTAHELFVYIDEHLQTAALDAGARQTPGLWPLRKHGKGQYVFFVPGRSLALPPAPPLTLDSNPWRGLSAYEAADRALFFGRSAQVAALRRHVGQQPLCVVLGASGTGKSSLVKAGLVPLLVDDGWQVLPVMRPGPSPHEALAEALGLPVTTQATLTDTALDGLEGKIRTRLRAQVSPHEDRRVVLVVDQWEELITLTRSTRQRERFLALVASLVAEHGEALRVIVTLRTDFESNFDRSVFGGHWPAGRFVVTPFSRDELRAVIELPAARQVLFFDPPTLVDTLVDEVIATPGGLPLLSFALSEMYIAYLRRRGDDRAITQADYDALGGVAGALRSRAEAEYAELGEAEQATLARVILRMVVADGGHFARRRVTDAELEFADAAENARRATVITRLTEARLLVRGREPDGETFVEPAHDALVRGWGRLIRWMQEASDAAVPLVTRQRLAAAALEWSRADAPAKRGLLWRDPVRSAQLAPLVKARAPWVNARELAFAVRSVRRRRIERALAVGVTAVVAVVAAVALWQGLLARRLVAQAYLLDAATVGADPRIAAANAAAALSALTYATTPDAGLYERLERFSLPPVMVEHRAGVIAAVFSPDGSRLATASRDSTARLWDARTGAPLGAPMQHRGVVVAVRFSPDGTLVVTASHDGTARVWDAITGVPVSEPMAHGASVNDVAFSPDGRLVVTGGEDGSAKVFEARSGTPVGPPMRHGTIVWEALLTVRFSPDGRRIITVRNNDPMQTMSYVGPGRIWEWPSGQHLRSGLDEAGYVMATNGALVLSEMTDGTALLWDTSTGRRHGPSLPGRGSIVTAAISPDGRWVATAYPDGTARLWDARSATQVGAPLRHDGAIRSVAFNAAGTMVVTASADSTARLWDARTGALIGSPLVHDLDLWSAVFSADGRHVVTAGPPIYTYRMAGSMSGLYNNPPPQPRDFSASVWPVQPTINGAVLRDAALASLDVSRDGRRLLTIRASTADSSTQAPASDTTSGTGTTIVNEARLWDSHTGQPIGAPLRHTGRVFRAAFSADGATVVTAGSDSAVRLWSGETGAPLGPPLTHPTAVLAASLDRNGSRVVTAAADGRIRVWDRRRGALRSPPSDSLDAVRDVTFTPDGARLLVTLDDDEDQRILDASAFTNASPLWSGPNCSQILHPDGRRSVRINCNERGEAPSRATLHLPARWCLQPPSGFFSHVLRDPLCEGLTSFFSQLPSAEWCRQRPSGFLSDVLLDPLCGGLRWFFNQPANRTFPLAHLGVVTTAAFSDDGALVMTASADSTARIWDAATGTPLTVPLVHPAAVVAASFSPDGERIVTAAADSTVRLWNSRTGTPIGAPMPLGDSVRTVRFTADGRSLITATAHDTTRLWDVRTVRVIDRDALLDLAEVMIAGRQRGPRDFVRGVPERSRRLLAWRARARDWADAPDGSFEQWAHWYFADMDTRPPQPGRWPSGGRR